MDLGDDLRDHPDRLGSGRFVRLPTTLRLQGKWSDGNDCFSVLAGVSSLEAAKDFTVDGLTGYNGKKKKKKRRHR